MLLCSSRLLCLRLLYQKKSNIRLMPANLSPCSFMVRHAKVLSMLAKRGYETSILALATVVGATPLLSPFDSEHQHGLLPSAESVTFSLRSWSENLESAPMNSQARDESILWRIWARFLDTLRAPRESLENIQGRQETCDLCERDYITPQIHKWDIPFTASVLHFLC